MAGTILISTESLYPVLAKLTLKKKSSDQINIRTEKKVGNNLAWRSNKIIIRYNQPRDEIW